MRTMNLSNLKNLTKPTEQFLLNPYVINRAFREHAIWSGNFANIKLYAETMLMIQERVR